MAGFEASIPFDFLVKTIGKSGVNYSTNMLFPVIHSKLDNAIKIRALLLNCLTIYYADFWKQQFDNNYILDRWARKDIRLTDSRFYNLTSEWNWHTPLRTDYERREAMLELDVLASISLGMTLEQLITIYNLKLRTPETLMRQGFIGFSDIRRHHIMHTVSGTFPINRAVLP